MSNDSVVLFCEQLKLSVGALDPNRASRYLDAIDQLFNDRISDSEIDLAIERVFKEDGGVLGFLKLAINQSKVFKTENVKSFDLLCKVIELNPRKVTPYATNTIIICTQYIRSMQTSAREKEKAVAVIEKFVIEKCCDSVDRRYVMEGLLNIEKMLKPGIVLSRIHELIGCFAKDYPDCIEISDGPKIRDMYFKTLEKAFVTQQDTSLVSLTGAFKGLNDFLQNFSPSDEHKEDFANRVYKCIKPMAQPMEGHAQKAVHRSALKLLADRCHLFGAQIFENFFLWHDWLVNTWLKMDQIENRRLANDLLQAIHREIAHRLQQNGDSDRDRCCEILKFLLDDFKNALQSSASDLIEVRRAIVGFGLLGAPAKKLLSPKDLDELLNLVMQRTKCVANKVNSKPIKDELEYFSEYVEALSKLMEQTVSLSGVQLNVLQEIIVAVIRNFHLLSSTSHVRTVNTLMRTFNNLLKLGSSVLDDILQKVILQGVIWTCSHKLPFDARNDWETYTDWKDHVTYNEYLPLWNGFLSETQAHNHSYDRNVIVRKVYDQMMYTLIRILDKLDLRVRKRVFQDGCENDQELFFSDPNYEFEPMRVKDFHIFFNLVGFYRAIWKAQSLENHKQNFVQWINQLVDVITSKSREYPLVSGFLGLMQIILGITNRLDYFETSSSSYNNVYHYLSSTIKKAQQSSGELQIACLKLLFTAPERMLCTLIDDMIPAYQIAFDIGKSKTSLFLAEMALSSIEKYMITSNHSSNERKPFLRAVLPYFDTYLQGFKCDSDQMVEISNSRRRTGTKRTAQKLIKVRESDLSKFQKQILFFLGNLEPEYCKHLVQIDDGNSGSVGEYTTLVKWSTTKIIRLKLYSSQDSFPEISMDELVPHLCEIATKTTDRQKKMTACEILQATILYLIGSYNHRGRLWSELCQLMLELACDPDLGVKQMFEPLVMQTMHYISKNDQRHQEGTKILLECLMNAISHPKNLSVRDLASRSLREFLLWTFRHDVTAEQSASSSSFNIVTLIQQLKMYNSDALQQRRFGAALAFNNIYRVLREQDPIIDKYWIDLLHDFCINFRLSVEQLEDGLSESESDLKPVSSALDHILRVLREKNEVFNTPNSNRVKPTLFSNKETILLVDAVLWLFSQCNSTQNSYRKKMMEMFVELAPCVAGYNSPPALVRDNQTTESLIKLCEKGIAIPQQSLDEADFESIYVWLKHLNSSLDCYMWMISNNFMLTWKPLFERSEIFKTLQYYIINVMNRNLFAQNAPDDHTFLLVQKEKINAKKSAILRMIFKFLKQTMAIDCVPNTIWDQPELLWVIETVVFSPSSLQCDTKSPEFLSHLSIELKEFIKDVFRCSAILLSFRNALSDKLYQTTLDTYGDFVNSIDEILSRSSIAPNEVARLNGLDLICGLIRAKYIQSSGSLNSIDVLASTILYKVFDGIKEKNADILYARSTTPDVRRFIGRLLQVCFNKNGIYINLIDLLLNTTELRLFESPQSIIKHGLHFLNSFKSIIYEYFLNNVDFIVGHLISKMIPPNVVYILRMLIELIESAHKLKSQNSNLMVSLTNLIVRAWPDILSKSTMAAEQNDVTLITTSLIELVGQVAVICPYPRAEIAKNAPSLEAWLLNIINQTDSNVEIKTQAITLLPCVIGPAIYEHVALENALEYFQKLYFPLDTSELRMGTVERSSYENEFQTVLDCMLASNSPLILKFIINCTAPDATHIMEHKIIESVQKFMGELESVHQLHCLHMVFGMFTNKSLDAAIRMVIMNRFVSYMILSSTKEVVTGFYSKHISVIGDLLDAPYNLTMKQFQLEQAFTSRIGGYQLLEHLSAVFTRDEICNKNFAVLIAKFGNVDAENKLLVWMTEKAVKVKDASFHSANTTYMEWFRKFQCAAFKCVCALVGNTQTALRFYQRYIFDEKNWSNIINTTDSNLYTVQTLDVAAKPQIKKRLLLIRQNDSNTTQSDRPRKYFESQTIFESSLSQDVTKIDLSSSNVRTAEDVEQRSRLENYQPKVLMLEQNAVNDHEAMAIVCGIIENMFENKTTPINEDGTSRNSKKLPWVESLCNLIANTSGTIHINIRIFLVTVVDNCSKWFRNYADAFTSSILKFLIDWIEQKDKIDALSIFLIVDLLEWDSMYKVNEPTEKELASNLLTELMKRADSEHKDIFRRNMELIRNLTEKWRDFVHLPYEFMYEKINDSNAESKSNICGIHLNAAVLANGLVPWNAETKPRFINAILNCLNNNYTQVYQPAAQVLGMILNELIVKQQNNGELSDENKTLVGKIFERLNRWKKMEEKKFMYVLYYIDQNYVIKGFLTSILTLVSSSSSDVKKFYLKMLLARVDEAKDSRDIELMLLALLDQSQQKEHQQQLIGLHIFNRSLAIGKFSITQIKHLLPLVAARQDAKQTEIRDLVYEIMKAIRKMYGADDETINTDTTKILLNGLNDAAGEIQRSVFEYWSQLPKLPPKLSDRVLYILRHLYSGDFLKYGVQLLLDLKSDEFQKQLLQRRNDNEQDSDEFDSKHTEYAIDVHWKTQDSSLRVPLFTESQQTHIINGEIDPKHSYLRATQTKLNFAPTLDPTRVHSSNNTFSLQSQNSLNFEMSTPILNRRSQFVRPQTAEKTAERTTFGYLRERILRNAKDQSRKKALNAIQQRNYRNVQETQQQKRKAGQVTLYRRYRFGDYPDFFINPLAFLLPLKMLVGTDAILARNAFVTIVKAIHTALKDPEQRHTFLTELMGIFGNIVKQPNYCDSLLFSAVTEILLTTSVSFDLDEILQPPNCVNDMTINTILLLENRLINTTNNSDEAIWSQLAELYYNLSEYDVASSICGDKIKSNRLLSTAIEYESNGDFKNALKTYKELIDTSTDNAIADLYSKHVDEYCNKFAFNSAFKCFEMMGRWEDLEGCVIDQLRETDEKINYEQLWDDEWNKNHLLPYYIRAELRQTLFYPKTQTTQQFPKNLDQWLRNAERADFIKRQFGEQLMIFYIAQRGYNRAKVSSDQYFESFLDEWSTMNVLSEKVRINKLMDARRVAEIHKYADLLSRKIDDTAIAKLCNRWSSTQIMQADSTEMWEPVIAYRIFITEQALHKYENETDSIAGRLIESMFDMQFKLNDQALKQQNFELSKSVLKFLHSFISGYGKDTQKCVLKYKLAKICLDQINLKQKHGRENRVSEIILPQLVKIWTNLYQIQQQQNQMIDTNPDIHIKLMDQFTEVADYCYETISECSSIDSSTQQAIFELTGCMDESQTTSQEICSFLRRCFHQTLETIEKCEKLRSHDIGESYYRLAIFCLKHHRTGSNENQREMSKLLIKSISRGMQYNSKNARLQFPRLLQLPTLNTMELTAVFNDEMKRVPLWTFIGSISQIISRFSFEKPCFLDNLVLSLATEYPSIVIYPFQLTYECFKERNPHVKFERPLIQQISKAIENTFLQTFVDSLKVLNWPDIVLKYYVSEFSGKEITSRLNQRHLKAGYNDVFNNPLRGKLPDKIQSYRKDFDELMQMFEQNDYNTIDAKATEINGKLKTYIHATKKTSKEKLMTLCPMLSQYHWYSSMDKFFELPGQYTGNAPPNPSTSLKIVKFNEEILTINSLRKPIKISCICSDGKTYSFIVKYAEDLRRDERIQHVQELMSDQMQLDKNCSQQKLSLRSYKVIPLNTKCGLIKWVENTESIHSFLSSKDAKWHTLNDEAAAKYLDFIKSGKKLNKKYLDYVRAILVHSPEEIARNLNECQKKIPENQLRRALYKLSATPECFFMLRNNFGRSLAVMSITHWLLGIGDRNLGNFLIDMNNGEMIGIDFNMAFGYATRTYNIPELVPFRLTAQFVNALKPLETSGFLMKSMIHVLRTVALEHESLMAALDVFVHDPTVDFAKPSDDRDTSSMDHANAWEPEAHLKTIKDKLSGINPMIPIVNDIKVSDYSSDADVVLAYIQLINGSPNTYRNQLKSHEHMTVEEQVKCLIDIARDPSVLGVSYTGLRPWV